MPLTLPNLDDRRWEDLVDEARALISFHAPQWTDHNASDPGITLLELIAWVTEMDVYRINRLHRRHRRQFLGLTGVAPLPARPARTVLQPAMRDGRTAPLTIPPGTEFGTTDATPDSPRFRTTAGVNVIDARLIAIQVQSAEGYQDLSRRLDTRRPFPLLGPDPKPGDAMLLGFDKAPPPDVPFTVYFPTDGERDDRARLEQERLAWDGQCGPPPSTRYCEEVGQPARPPRPASPTPAPPAVPPRHHSARTAWEFLSAAGWQMLDADAGEVLDDTRAFTLAGAVTFRLPVDGATSPVGALKQPLFYLRCRLLSGALDSPAEGTPVLNGVPVEQSVPAFTELRAAPGTPAPARIPAKGETVRLDIDVDRHGVVTALRVDDPADPWFRVLDIRLDGAGRLAAITVAATWLGRHGGFPYHAFSLPSLLHSAAPAAVLTRGPGGWQTWALRPHLDDAGPDDAAVALAEAADAIAFGDGRRGLVPDAGSAVWLTASYTLGEGGNARAGAIGRLSDSATNRALPTLAELRQWLSPERTTNPLPAHGGAAAQTLDLASAAIAPAREITDRAVTLEDYQRLAMQTPGVRLARAEARANVYPALPWAAAPGNITVIVLSPLPVDRPSAGPGLMRLVQSYLRRRRVIGTAVHVVTPNYVRVSIRTIIARKRGASAAALPARVAAALDRFFHPLRGGDDGAGWPFGRDVYRAEVLQVIDAVEGVEHVVSLELVPESGEPTCGNLCIGPFGLVDSGPHDITVEGEQCP